MAVSNQNQPIVQYVGPYMVPHGWTAWNDQTQYQPLAVVSYNLAWYILKQPAQVGTPPTNNEYWAQVDNWQGQLVDLQKTINNLSDEVEVINKELDPLTELVLIGDSWADINVNPILKPMGEKLSERLNLNIHNYAHSGTGFDVPLGYNAQWTEMLNDNSFNHDKIKYVVLVLGINEYHAGTNKLEFSQKLETFINRIRETYNGPIYWFHNYSVSGGQYGNNIDMFWNQYDYYNSIISALDSDIIAPDTFGWVSEWGPDFFHPSTKGNRDFATNMANIICGANPTVYPLVSVNCSGDVENISTFNNFTINYYYTGGNLILEINPTIWMLSQSINKKITFSITTENIIRLPAIPETLIYIGYGFYTQSIQTDNIIDFSKFSLIKGYNVNTGITTQGPGRLDLFLNSYKNI